MSEDNKRAPIKIDCPLPGHEGEYVLFRPDGWRFRHLRLWEDTNGAGRLAELVGERIQDWKLTCDGQDVPFPGSLPKQLDKDGQEIKPALDLILDDLSPEVGAWLFSLAFRQAYDRVGMPDPNAS